MLTNINKCKQKLKKCLQNQLIRGGIKIENRENLGQCPNRGGGGG